MATVTFSLTRATGKYSEAYMINAISPSGNSVLASVANDAATQFDRQT